MSKIKIKMELTGFKLEIEGSSEDVPQIQQALGRQLASMMQPPTDAVGGAASLSRQPPPALGPAAPVQPADEVKLDALARKKPRKKRSSANGTVDDVELVSAVDWRHDASKYGVPSQSWTTTNKALWTLYVAKQETGETELSGKRIALTFNKHFRQAKEILVGQVNRDLGISKIKKMSPVAQDTTKDVPTWYLTEEGTKAIQQLIIAATTPSAE
jgi:hypothetical protein